MLEWSRTSRHTQGPDVEHGATTALMVRELPLLIGGVVNAELVAPSELNRWGAFNPG
jgi:hypothetical protein